MKICCDEKIIRDIAKVVKITGDEVYMVGGYVRDKILGKEPKDIDFVVVGNGIEFAEKVADYYKIRKIIKYKRFETAKIPFRGSEVEFVSAREELYNENSRKPIVKKASLHSDIMRRDFTINTLAVRVSDEVESEVVDFVDGLKDLEAGVIKTPLDPFITYSEDPLRMIRAIRFSSRFGYEIEERSFDAIAHNLERLSIVSAERVTDEFFKIVDSDRFVEGIELMESSGLLRVILPELDRLKGVETIDGVSHKDIFKHTLKVTKTVSKLSDKRGLRIAALFHDIGKYKAKRFIDGGWCFHRHEEFGSNLTKTIGDKLRWPRQLIDYVSKMVKLHHRPINLTTNEVTDSGVRRLLFEGGSDVEDLMILCRADITTAFDKKREGFLKNYDILQKRLIEVEEKDHLRNFKPDISGKDIMEILGVTQGPTIGKVKGYIVDEIISGNLKNCREDIIVTIKKFCNGELKI